MSDTSASTSPADLTPADDAWRFTLDNQPTTDDIAAIEQMLAENLGLDIDEVRAMDLDGDDPADADVPLSDVIANPPTAGDVMGSDDLSDDQDVDVDLAPPTADAVDDPQSAPQAGDTGAGTATTPAPEPTGDLIWRDADANGTDADATAGHDFEDPGEQAASPLPADSGVLDTYFRVAYGEEDPRRAIDAIEQNLQVVRQINSLPADRQAVIGAWLRGEDVDVPAPQSTPTPAPAPTPDQFRILYDEYGNEVRVPLTPDPATAPTPPPTDPRVDALIRQQEYERQVAVQRGVQSAVQSFRANHPELSTDDIAALAQRVTQINAWAYESAQGVPADEAFLRHLEGNLAIDPNLSAKSRVAAAASTPAPPATQAPARQARSAAIAGASAPSTTAGRRRSAVSGNAPPPAAPAKDRQDLAKQIEQAIQGRG